MAIRKRKNHTSLVINPSRGLSIGGRSTVRRAARKNPVSRTSAAIKTNPKRRRRRRRNPASPLLRVNPSSMTGMLVAATMTAATLTVFDAVVSRVLPNGSLWARVGVKLGGAALFQSSLGSKIPVAAKYKNEIALVLAVLGIGDILRAYVVPPVSSAISNISGGALSLLPASAAPAAAPAGELGRVWRRPAYY